LAVFAPGELVFAQGYLVPNGVTFGPPSPWPYTFTVVRNPSNGWTTAFGFSGGPVLFRYDSIVDVGVRVFQVQFSEPISQAAIQANAYPEFTYPGPYTLTNNQSFYVGIYTGADTAAPLDGIYKDPLFGWARIRNRDGVLELLSSALSYQTQGIYAGTQNFVAPEPNAAPLCLLGALVGLLRPTRKL
jgi:hypothetical protein